MVDRSMRGLFPILAMPFDAHDDIDVEDLQREVDFAIDAGVDGLGIAFGSEVNRLSEDERGLAARTVIAQAAGRVPVVVNTGADGPHRQGIGECLLRQGGDAPADRRDRYRRPDPARASAPGGRAGLAGTR